MESFLSKRSKCNTQTGDTKQNGVDSEPSAVRSVIQILIKKIVYTSQKWAGIAQSVQRLATGWTVQGSNSGGGEIFRARSDRPWGPPSLLYNGYRVFFPGIKRLGRGIKHPLPSSAEVKERVRLYL